MKQEKFHKLINKYFAKNLENYFCNFLKVYYVDTKFKYTKNTIEMYVKNKLWKDEFYVLVFVIPYEECFKYFVNDYEMDLLKDNAMKVIREKLYK